MARPTLDLLLRDLDAELDRAGASAPRLLHLQMFFTVDSREFLLRFAMDEHEDERRELLSSVLGDIEDGRPVVTKGLARDVTGVAGIVACRREDGVRWLREQTDENFAWAAAVPLADNGDDWVYRQFVSHGVDLPLGLSSSETPDEVLEWTLGQLVDSAPTLHPGNGEQEAPRTAAMFEVLERLEGSESVALIL